MGIFRPLPENLKILEENFYPKYLHEIKHLFDNLKMSQPKIYEVSIRGACEPYFIFEKFYYINNIYYLKFHTLHKIEKK